MVFDTYHAQIPLDALLGYLSPYKTHLPARFRDRWALFHTVYILSSYPLEELYKMEQMHSWDLWQAFLRRINHVYFCKMDGTLEEIPLNAIV